MKIKTCLIISLFAVSLFASLPAWSMPSNDYAVLKDTKELSMVLKLVDRLKLDSWLIENKATVFAPTDKAFKEFPKKLMEHVSDENAELRLKILQHHVAGGSYTRESLKDKQVITLLDGETLKVSIKGDKAYVNGALLRQSIPTGQGVVYIIDKLLKTAPK